jgi:hypothetical protein
METTQPLNRQQQHLGNEKFRSNLNMQAISTWTRKCIVSEPPGGRLSQMIEGICPFEVIMHGYREYRWEPGTCAYLEDCDWEPVQRLTQLSLGTAQLAQV